MEIVTRLPGVFNVENVLGAVAAALLLDLDADAIVEGIGAVAGVAGRFEAIDEGQDFAVVVDYSHKPDALAAVLRAARALGDGRLTVVFGAGGDRDRMKRPEMGRVARQLADSVIVTSDNPRSEDPLEIIGEILQGAGTEVEVDPDRRSAIETAIERAEDGDVVVIAGKGHEQGQEIAGVVHPFDDREVSRTALRALRERA
jgi:UDP-N-acetylmuramoyl-L-alanyl-D-glutamate--2,6-diaminopimelate ligase